MAARSFLGAGDIFINRIVDGVPRGIVGPLKANRMEIQPQVDTKESTSKGRYDYGQVLESVNLAQPTEFSLELKEVTGDVLVMAFLGTSSELNQASGALSAQSVVMGAVGFWVEIGKKNLSQLITVTGTADATLVEGVDYELNRPLGWIRSLEGGDITAAMTVKVTGGYQAATGTVIAGSTRTEVRARVLFDGINQADGTQCTVDIFEAILSADSAFDFLADEFGNVTLTGRLKTPVGKSTPYEVTIQDPVA